MISENRTSSQHGPSVGDLLFGLKNLRENFVMMVPQPMQDSPSFQAVLARTDGLICKWEDAGVVRCGEDCKAEQFAMYDLGYKTGQRETIQGIEEAIDRWVDGSPDEPAERPSEVTERTDGSEA